MLIARSAIEGENRLLLSGLIHSCLGCRKSCFNRELCTKNKTSGVLLRHRFYSFKPSESLKYAALGLLFVNIAVGGVLTQFASPPVVIVVRLWNWNLVYMLTLFGWKAVVGIISSNLLTRQIRPANPSSHRGLEKPGFRRSACIRRRSSRGKSS